MAPSQDNPAAARNLGKGKIATAVAILGERIVAGDFAPGRPLPVEADLAQTLDVGRSVLREAIKVLASKGMVSARPRLGTMILPRSQWNLFDHDVLHWMLRPGLVEPGLLRDILVARAIIEPQAARLAAINATMSDKANIRAAFRAMAESVGDPDASVRADIQFHTSILEASHNAILHAFSPALTAILSAFFQISIQNPEIFPGNLPAHERVAREIDAEDPEAAHAAMLDVLGYTEADLTERLKL
ncbi:FadR family transcriptional regulator [Arsenicitalea aurantiaca]|uniref:FadR family transcriptional regulator n=1 Tax=Arsenicitalea aurantiaca TaxID=1783274 RepID=A0A433XB37_9HYPH|nr:FadR/GntR family transcriptional regulator [Arsenicitalea aurantiaca]RUT31285.1 FadR family transcriptional regulator [Arsenicitalea aurantiaca]